MGRRLESGDLQDLQHKRPLYTQPPAAQCGLHQAAPPREADGQPGGHHDQLPGGPGGAQRGSAPHEGSPEASQGGSSISHPPGLPLLPLQTPLHDGRLHPPGRHGPHQWRPGSLPREPPHWAPGGRLHLAQPPLPGPDQVGPGGRHARHCQGRGRPGVLLPPRPRELRQHVGQGEEDVPAAGGGRGGRPHHQHPQVRQRETEM